VGEEPNHRSGNRHEASRPLNKGPAFVLCLHVNKTPLAVVFDMDGLLFDSEALYRDAIVAAASELGYSFTVEDFLKLVGRPWPVNWVALQEHIGPSGNVDTFRSTWMRRYESMRANLALKVGVRELLSRLDELNCHERSAHRPGTMTVTIPAAAAARMPLKESSSARQAQGVTPSISAARINGSGAGLPRM
jgi:beta-phosphoglucomutase-like phosphatase (HAD superfamily)